MLKAIVSLVVPKEKPVDGDCLIEIKDICVDGEIAYPEEDWAGVSAILSVDIIRQACSVMEMAYPEKHYCKEEMFEKMCESHRQCFFSIFKKTKNIIAYDWNYYHKIPVLEIDAPDNKIGDTIKMYPIDDCPDLWARIPAEIACQFGLSDIEWYKEVFDKEVENPTGSLKVKADERGANLNLSKLSNTGIVKKEYAKPGDRVGVITGIDSDGTVYLLGYGTYCGVCALSEEARQKIISLGKLPNNKGHHQVRLDSGEMVWGGECLWDHEKEVKELVKNASLVVDVDINDYRVLECNN